MKQSPRLLTLFCFLLCGVLFSGCAAKSASAWREYKIFCGLSSQHGEVPDEAWTRFCDKHVSAAFPDGYTVLDGTGYWRSGPETTAKERAKVILVLAPADAREKVLAVARQYCKEFDQNTVLISGSGTEAEFVSAEDVRGK